MTNKDASDDTETFRIGAVSQLTGIPVDTLRVWERRYEVVRPQRSDSGNRLYSTEDVERLRLIRQLVNRSHAIGTVCHLDLSQLRERLSASQASEAPPEGAETRPDAGPISVTIAGPTLGIKLGNALAPEVEDALAVVAEYTTPGALLAADATVAVDAAILEFDTMREADVTLVRRLHERLQPLPLAVVYGFAPLGLIESLRRSAAVVVRQPIDWPMLVAGLRAAIGRDAAASNRPSRPESPPARLYSDRQLAAVAGLSVALKCECPHHLAELIGSLARFEKYSAQCELETEQDAQLHHYLHDRTAQARLLMERALQRVMQREGLSLPDAD